MTQDVILHNNPCKENLAPCPQETVQNPETNLGSRLRGALSYFDMVMLLKLKVSQITMLIRHEILDIEVTTHF